MSKAITLFATLVGGALVLGTMDLVLGIQFISTPASIVHKVAYMLWGAILIGINRQLYPQRFR